jgi:hypothetical protein
MSGAGNARIVGFALFSSAALMVGLGLWLASDGGPLDAEIRAYVLAACLVAAIIDAVIALVMIRRAAEAPPGRR